MCEGEDEQAPGAVKIEFGDGRETVHVNPDSPVGADEELVAEILADLRTVANRAREQENLVTAALASHTGTRAVVYYHGSLEGTFLDGSWLADGTRFEDVFGSPPKRQAISGLLPLSDGDAVAAEQARLVTDGGEPPNGRDLLSGPDPDEFRIPTIQELGAMRVAHGLSQKELSRRAGLEPSRFNHILHNDIDPQTETMRAFLDVLQTTDPQTTDDLAEKRGPKPKPSSLTGQLEALQPEALGLSPVGERSSESGGGQ